MMASTSTIYVVVSGRQMETFAKDSLSPARTRIVPNWKAEQE